MPSEPTLTEKNRRQEEQARADRERHFKQQRDRGIRGGEAATGPRTPDGRSNLREKDK